MSVPPVLPVIDYTSRDYLSIRSDLVRLVQQRLPLWTARDPSDFGVALVEAVSYTADQLHYYLDRVANEAYLGTAVQRESVTAIAQMMGYEPYDAQPAMVEVELSNTANADVTVPAGARVQATIEQEDGTLVRSFETDMEVVVPAKTSTNGNTPTVSVSATEGRTYREELAGVSSGLAFQRMVLPRASILQDTVKISSTLGDVTVWWTKVDRLEDASDDDRAFILERQTDGSTVVVFGDGLTGEIPALHSQVFSSYRVGGGAGNVPANTVKVMVEPVLPTIGVNNPQPAYGGRNAESLASIRVNAARSFRARDRAVTLYDYMSMAKAWPNIAKAKAVANNGVSIVVFLTANDDGTGKPTLTKTEEAAVRASLTNASMAGVTVTVMDTLWLALHVTMTVHCQPTAQSADVEDRVRETLARLFSFENFDFDARITMGDILTALYGVPGLAYVTVEGMDVQPGTTNIDPLLFSEMAVNAVPYWDEGNLDLTMVGGVQ